MNETLILSLIGNTFRGTVDSPAELPTVGEVGHIYQIGNETWGWGTQGSWRVVGLPDADTVINIERAISAFEGVMIVFRRPSYELMTKGYTFTQPVHDSEPVDVLRKRLADTWPNCAFEIMDGRSRWDHTQCKTMGQLRNSYLMSRSPE